MNDKNLRKIQSTDEARELGAKGGKASGEARRKRKLIRECLNEMLSDRAPTEADKTGVEAIAATLFLKALDGDLKAFELIRDTVGEKIPDRAIVSSVDIDPAVIEEIERMINNV